MTDNDFRAAVQIEVTRWQFAQLVARNFEHPATGGSKPTVDDPALTTARVPDAGDGETVGVLDLRDSAEARTPRPVNNSAT